jgi:hypothetical protein
MKQPKRRGVRAGWVGTLAVFVGGCAPLTFSKSSSVDFEEYSSVYVTVSAPDVGGDYAREYLASRLRQSSGFSLVTTDPEVAVDLELHIDVRVTPPPGSPDVVILINSGDETGVDISGESETADYDATAAFVATSADGDVIDFGVQEDTSYSTLEAVHDVLDQVDLHYMRPYRL